MVVDAENTEDQHVKRAAVLTACGGGLPFFALAILLVIAGIVNLITGKDVISAPLVNACIFTFLAIGQAAVWSGLYYFRRARLWDSRVVAVLWLPGFTSPLAVLYTGASFLALLPLIAPIVGSAVALRTRFSRAS